MLPYILAAKRYKIKARYSFDSIQKGILLPANLHIRVLVCNSDFNSTLP